MPTEKINSLNLHRHLRSIGLKELASDRFKETLSKTNMRYTWISFYKEFAEKLMNYRNDRASLLSLIYENRDLLCAGYLHDNKGEDDLLTDVDPFTVLGLLNRGISSEKRINSAKLLKKLFNINSEAPTDFVGIPRLNNQRSYFFGYRNMRGKKI